MFLTVNGKMYNLNHIGELDIIRCARNSRKTNEVKYAIKIDTIPCGSQNIGETIYAYIKTNAYLDDIYNEVTKEICKMMSEDGYIDFDGFEKRLQAKCDTSSTNVY